MQKNYASYAHFYIRIKSIVSLLRSHNCNLLNLTIYIYIYIYSLKAFSDFYHLFELLRFFFIISHQKILFEYLSIIHHGFNAVIGTTYTPSGLLYAAFVRPQTTQSTDGSLPFSLSICFFKLTKF